MDYGRVFTTAGKFKDELIKTAKAIGAPGKGILATDEDTELIGSKFKGVGVENTRKNRQAYRQLLYSAPGIQNHISGVIMLDEMVTETNDKGKKFVDVLRDRGIICGVKVDTGMVVMAGTDGETATTGLDGLGEKCKKFYALGCRFAKWRAAIKITPTGCPSEAAIRETAHSLARYGSICQQHGLVPVIEPDVLQDGDHNIEVCAEVSERVFSAVMSELQNQHLLIEGLFLKPSMVTPGASCPDRSNPREIAWMTVRTLSRTIVSAVPTVAFLSGGSSEENASLFLNSMN